MAGKKKPAGLAAFLRWREQRADGPTSEREARPLVPLVENPKKLRERGR